MVSLLHLPSRIYILTFLSSLGLCLAYAFIFQALIYDSPQYVHPDTSDFLNTFLNLVRYGKYCANLTIQDSCFYRQPSYPLFLGPIYLAFGGWVWLVIAIIQSLMIAVSSCLLVASAASFSSKYISLKAVCFVSSTYPFFIFFVPLQIPEVLSVFLVTLVLFLILRWNGSLGRLIIPAALIAFLSWTKQYNILIAFMLPSFLIVSPVKLSFSLRARAVAVLLVFALSFYGVWPLRNLIEFGKPVTLIGDSTGTSFYRADFSAAMKFYRLFYENPTEQLDHLVKTGTHYLPNIPFVVSHESDLQSVARLGNECGPSFLVRKSINLEESASCEKEVAYMYKDLLLSAKQELSMLEANMTSFQALGKGFLKLDMRKGVGFYASTRSLFGFQNLLFVWRFFLIILAFFSMIFSLPLRTKLFCGISCFIWLSLLIALSFSFSSLEVRYLLAADALLLIPASVSLGYIIRSIVPIMLFEKFKSSS